MQKDTEKGTMIFSKNKMTRRHFLRITGKGLAALVFAEASLRFGLPLTAQADTGKISVNTLVSGKNEMRVIFIERVDEDKSDAFYILNITPKGLEVFLVDGGKNCGRCTQELTELRADILKRSGLESKIGSSQYVLDITLLISHFHGDHVNELHNNLLPAVNKLRVKEAYYPAPTALPQDGTYKNEKNDDIGLREKVLTALNIYHKECKQHALSFGETLDLTTTLGSIRLYASPVDWGTGDYLTFMRNIHFAGNPFKVSSGMATEVLNGNCMWVRAEYAGHSVLFTGDANKKYSGRTDECYDMFIKEYGEELRSDIVKFPHHGRGRDAACEPTRDYLLTKNSNAACVLTGSDGPALAGVRLTKIGVSWYDLENGNVVFSLTDDDMQLISGAANT